jgi:DNA (cytosine-5)-methyltransferase 1
MALGACISDLESEGYEVQPFILPASAINAPHRRYRVFIIAMANSKCMGWKERSTKSEKFERKETSNQFNNSNKRRSEFEPSQDVANSKSSNRYDNEVNKEHGQATTQKIFGNRSSFSREGSWFSSEPNVGRVVNGVPNRVDRIKSLGNAVVPQLAYAVGQCIIQAIQEDV